MKRDLNLIRNIMLRIEASNKTSFTASDFIDLCDNENMLYYNIHLMYQAGFIDAFDISCCGFVLPQYQIQWLSNLGCEYLDSVRNDSVWSKTKTVLKSVGGNASFEVVKDISSKFLMEFLESQLPT